MTFGTGELLDTIVKRAKLPITARGWPGYDVDGVPVDGDVWLIRSPGRLDAYAFDAYSATRAYFDLVSTLTTDPGTPSVSGCDGSSAILSPAGGM